jgi:hypothetical protein
MRLSQKEVRIWINLILQLSTLKLSDANTSSAPERSLSYVSPLLKLLVPLAAQTHKQFSGAPSVVFELANEGFAYLQNGCRNAKCFRRSIAIDVNA